MKIYTKTGDRGDTGLFGGPRVSKDSPRIETYGTVDELNSLLGVARSQGLDADLDVLIGRIQNELFCVGAELATPNPAAHAVPVVGEEPIAALEAAIDRHEQGLAPLSQFILPGGVPAAATLHLARTVCRRAERRLVTLMNESTEPVNERLLIYLNRLGDLLFVLGPRGKSGGEQPGCSLAEAHLIHGPGLCLCQPRDGDKMADRLYCSARRG